jgi:HAD superfamily hydrolase (TIGR01450 family)
VEGSQLKPLTKADRLYKGYIFDADGTIYLSDRLLPGAAEAVRALRQAGSAVVFVSNNPTVSQPDIAAKLTRLGVPTLPPQVINSTMVLVEHLKSNAPGARVYPIGEQPLIDALLANGFSISEQSGEIDYVIASFDRTFVYRKLQIGFDAIRAGARFIATNADPYCPVAGGGQPDAAAIIAALEACTGVKVEQILGKPSAVMATTALHTLGVPPEECLLAGDRLLVDVVMGQRAGIHSALVLSGATTRDELLHSEITPDYVFETLLDALPDGLAW